MKDLSDIPASVVGRSPPGSEPRPLGVGYLALRVLFAAVEDQESPLLPVPYHAVTGTVGSMETKSIYAAIQARAEREGIIESRYHRFHALYHAIQDALEGILRNPAGLGPTLRTAGLVFSVVRGPRFIDLAEEGDWIAVAIFGTAGPPKRGWEHEVVGLGVNHV